MIGWPWNAHVGQRVTPKACVRCWRDVATGETCDGPEFGGVYAIAAIGLEGTELYFSFAEYPGDEEKFDATGFRPVKDTSAQVEELKRLCLPQHKPEPVA